jgi:hypothetical protein
MPSISSADCVWGWRSITLPRLALRMVGTAEPRTGGAVSLVSCAGGWPSRSLRIFIGPMRTVVSLTAGIFAMPMLLFQMATIASGFVWAFIKLLPGVGLTVLTKGCSGEFFAAGRIKAGTSLVYRAWNIPEDVPRSSPATSAGSRRRRRERSIGKRMPFHRCPFAPNQEGLGRQQEE